MPSLFPIKGLYIVPAWQADDWSRAFVRELNEASGSWAHMWFAVIIFRISKETVYNNNGVL